MFRFSSELVGMVGRVSRYGNRVPNKFCDKRYASCAVVESSKESPRPVPVVASVTATKAISTSKFPMPKYDSSKAVLSDRRQVIDVFPSFASRGAAARLSSSTSGHGVLSSSFFAWVAWRFKLGQGPSRSFTISGKTEAKAKTSVLLDETILPLKAYANPELIDGNSFLLDCKKSLEEGLFADNIRANGTREILAESFGQNKFRDVLRFRPLVKALERKDKRISVRHIWSLLVDDAITQESLATPTKQENGGCRMILEPHCDKMLPHMTHRLIFTFGEKMMRFKDHTGESIPMEIKNGQCIILNRTNSGADTFIEHWTEGNECLTIVFCISAPGVTDKEIMDRVRLKTGQKLPPPFDYKVLLRGNGSRVDNLEDAGHVLQK